MTTADFATASSRSRMSLVERLLQFAPTRVCIKRPSAFETCDRCETRCRRGQAQQSKGCAADGCNSNLFDVVCAHQRVEKSVEASGVLVLLLATISLIALGSTWLVASGRPAILFGAWSIGALLFAMAILARLPDARATLSAQMAAMCTLTGAALLTRSGDDPRGIAIGVVVFALGGLIPSALNDRSYGPISLFRLVIVCVAIVAFGFGALAAITGIPSWRVFAISGIGAAIVFFTGFAQPAAQRVFGIAISVPARTPKLAPRQSRQMKPISARAHGLLRLIESMAIQMSRFAFRIRESSLNALNISLARALDVIRLTERRVRIVLVRLGQIVRAVGQLAMEWWKTTWTMLDDVFHPSVSAIILLAAAGVCGSVAAEHLVAYVRADDGFGARGWLKFAEVVALSGAGISCVVLACATYGDEYLTALKSISNLIVELLPYGILVCVASVMTSAVGMPILARLPIVGGVMSAGSRDFGPAATLSLVMMLVISIVAVRIMHQESAPSEGSADLFDFRKLFALLPRALRALELAVVAPMLGVAVASATVVVTLASAAAHAL